MREGIFNKSIRGLTLAQKMERLERARKEAAELKATMTPEQLETFNALRNYPNQQVEENSSPKKTR